MDNIGLEMEPLTPPFRLTTDWYRQNLRRLQSKLEARELNGVILSDIRNINYFSGLFCTETERPIWLFVPTEGDPTIFHPAVDIELVDSWWIRDRQWYFDFPHHGAFNSREFSSGPEVDLLEWMLGSLAERGFSMGKLGIDREVGLSTASKMKKALPQVSFCTVKDLCLRMRMIKTSAEIALIKKALALQDYMLEYARRLVLQYGTDITDFDVAHETKHHATHLLMEWLKLDGKPHSGVGVDLCFGCRAGASTAYPHPNQFLYHKINRGDAIQFAGFVHLGGYVGEGYRACQIMPMSGRQRKAWEIHTDMTLLQARLSSEGTRCSDIAHRVLEVANKAGMKKYVYHRPAHGIGMEGHQPPYIALGDKTLLQQGMLFSNEPGLFNPFDGWGYLHSNTVLVGSKQGIVLNAAPLTKDWCWMKL